MKKWDFTFLTSMLNFKLSFHLERTTTLLSSYGKSIKKMPSLVIDGIYFK